MVRSVEGIFRNGKVELLEAAPQASDSRVIVTFLPAGGLVNLADRQITPAQAQDLRARLKSFEEDWHARRWTPTMPYDCGDVVLVLFPDSNLRTAKRRPALVLMSDGLNTGLPQTIVAMISSNMTRAGHPSRIKVLKSTAEGRGMGLLTDSVVMTDNLATVLHHEIDRVIGRCPDIQPVKNALRITFDL